MATESPPAPETKMSSAERFVAFRASLFRGRGERRSANLGARNVRILAQNAKSAALLFVAVWRKTRKSAAPNPCDFAGLPIYGSGHGTAAPGGGPSAISAPLVLVAFLDTFDTK